MKSSLVFTALLACVPVASWGTTCPTATAPAWPKGTTVYYQIRADITGTELTEINQAIADWNTANASNASGGVNFQPTNNNHPYPMLTFDNGSTPVGIPGQTTKTSTGGVLDSASTIFNPNAVLNDGVTPAFNSVQLGYSTAWHKVALHEIGHTMGLDDVTINQTPGATVENQFHNTNESGNYMANSITSCDNASVGTNKQYAPPPSCTPQQCARGVVACNCLPSPIIVDWDGSGFQLTDAAGGVIFDIEATGVPIQIAWTALGSTNAFLALDRNGNGTIDSGAELFGNATPQPSIAEPNGFNALAMFDSPQYGGNGNGKIDPGDSIYSKLWLWIDSNHDGVSQPAELHSLSELGVTAISLDYGLSRRVDQYGNEFEYRSTVSGAGSHWCYDVFLVTQSNPAEHFFQDVLRDKQLFATNRWPTTLTCR
jgi:hypothetical protein